MVCDSAAGWLDHHVRLSKASAVDCGLREAVSVSCSKTKEMMVTLFAQKGTRGKDNGSQHDTSS